MNREPMELEMGLETHRSTEIVSDEDVLSPSLRAALEQVGSATGLLLALALVFALFPRAGRLLNKTRAATGAEKSAPGGNHG